MTMVQTLERAILQENKKKIKRIKPTYRRKRSERRERVLMAFEFLVAIVPETQVL